MKWSLLGFFLPFSIPLGCAVEQPKFPATLENCKKEDYLNAIFYRAIAESVWRHAMKRALLVSLIAVVLPFTVFAAEQPKFEATMGSVREAIARGEGKEALSALESQASEAESKGEWAKAAGLGDVLPGTCSQSSRAVCQGKRMDGQGDRDCQKVAQLTFPRGDRSELL